MKFAYICSPYSGNIEYNLDKARRYCRFATQQTVVPLAPHVIFTQFLDDNIREEREAGLYLGKELLRKCQEVWVFGNKLTAGMAEELKLAQQLNMPIRYFDEKCEEKEGVYR